jgi:FAD/FMN-containing dehydrogenase
MSSPVRQHPAFAAFAAAFSGALLTDGPEYDEARVLHNAMIDAHPALIAQCASPDDVAAALAFARDAELEVAVRAGGHSVAGMSTVEGGIVVDVRPMDTVTIDAAAKTARVGAGATWSQFDRAAQEHGLATPGGRVSTTGVAGFTLGGGSGWIERKYGLACDNLISVDLVLANGEQVTASTAEHADLFWALHGGGGNFGVATSFEFELHPVGPVVLAGLMLWPAAAGPDVATAFRDIVESAPEELGGAFVSLTGPPEEFVPQHLQGQPAFAVAVCWIGEHDEGNALLEPLRALVPEADLVGPMPYADFQCMLDDPPGLRNYWSAEYLAELNTDAIATYFKTSTAMPSPTSQNLMAPWGGAVAREAADTPMSKRDAKWVFHPFATWESAADDAINIAWARDSNAAMRPHATGGVYLNFIGDEGQDRIRAAYGEENYRRLAEIKAQYDPENVFRGNQNIMPAVPTG